ncbi:MAG: phosphatidate cytidylyltransferase [candidate division Zixibacteria bacterium]|nr:phosphatidate cytidylyltransferase [candidate division Zixibacteria bacterium]
MSRNLLTRIAVAIVAIPAILWISYQGGWWLFGMISLFAIGAALEFLINEGFRPVSVLFWLGLVTVGLLLASRYPGLSWDGPIPFEPLVVILSFMLIAGMILATGRIPPAQLFEKNVRLVWGVAYIGLLYPFVFLLGSHSATGAYLSGDLLLFLFGLLWVGDTAAMGIGKWLGKHKLASAVSPNKTVEGFLGGLVGALLIGLLMSVWRLHDIPRVHLVSMAICCSVFGQLGDLVESMWKRSLGIKDSSPVIPGHGGVLDRFDSLLFAAPVMYYYVTIFRL